MELHELVERTDSRESFLAFLAALRSDLQTDEAEWENPVLDRYLEAMHSWTGSMRERLLEPTSWRTFAEILCAAKIYE